MSSRSGRRTRAARSSERALARPRVVAIVGATGSGKSALAVRLARRFGGAIIAADSRTIYRGLNIGTAKPSRADRRTVPHYGLDLVPAGRRFSAAEFQRYVYRTVSRLYRAHPERPVFLVGGTMLYIDAVLKGLDFAGAPPDFALRQTLEQKTADALFRQLERRDPTTAAGIDRRNRRRLVRALEVALSTKRSFYERRTATPPDWDVLVLGVRVPPVVLEQQQQRRINYMLRRGWRAEVARLLRRYRPNDPGMSALGYPEVAGLVRGELTLEHAKAAILSRTRQITRRQLAWFKKYKKIHWVDPSSGRAARLVRTFVE